MTFAAALPLSGYAGWKFLGRTRETQQATLAASPAIKNNADYFREKIGTIRSAEELVADRRLLTVALGAFGLDEDINNKFFIRKVLEGSTSDPKALANKLSDKRYLEMAKAFGFGDYSTTRLTENATRELPKIAAEAGRPDAKWAAILGNAALREVVTKGLNLGAAFETLAPARQIEAVREAAETLLGSTDPAMFADPERVKELNRLFVAQSGLEALVPGFDPAKRVFPNTQFPTFADEILSPYKTRQFERAVGEQDQSLRLAMNAERELAAIAGKSNSESTKWFTIMGNAPLRQVFETAFGLPKEFGSVDLDQQLGEFQKRAEQFLGSSDPAIFTDPAKVEELVKLFLLRTELSGGISASARGSAALSILQNSPVPSLF